MKHFSVEEVSSHNTPTDAWIIIDNKVFDITKFASLHPGGKTVLLNEAGKDSTKEFLMFHKISVLEKYIPKLCIGYIQKEEKKQKTQDSKYFGELTPYVDPAWYQGHYSPYYNESHRNFRKACREYCEKHVKPFVSEWDVPENAKFPKDLHKTCYEAGIYGGFVGFPKKYTDVEIAGGVKPEEVKN
jgi:predicted heme/steroid binding protein